MTNEEKIKDIVDFTIKHNIEDNVAFDLIAKVALHLGMADVNYRIAKINAVATVVGSTLGATIGFLLGLFLKNNPTLRATKIQPMNDVWTYALCFMLSFVTNTLWAFYIKYVNESSQLKAAIFGEMILVCGATMTYNYVHDLRLLVPVMVGGFLGTYYNNRVKTLVGLDKKNPTHETEKHCPDAMGPDATASVLEEPGAGTHPTQVQ